MRKRGRNPKLKLQFFRNLPPEIIIDIVSRLPIRSIGACKCVCKSWRNLLHTREFTDFHLSKSVPALFIGYDSDLKNYKIFEFDDELGLESHDLHYNQIIKFDSTGFERSELKGSSNGLFLFLKRKNNTELHFDSLFVCNPITREYIALPQDGIFYCYFSATVAYGFGVSKMTAQYKVVKIFHSYICEHKYHQTDEILGSTRYLCMVYTLGTGVWRSVAVDACVLYDTQSNGVSLNGNLHWLVEEALVDFDCISCFDLETETFSAFAPPPLTVSRKVLVSLVVLKDCLCVCDSTPADEIVIWSMKDYGDEKSWTKEFVLTKIPDLFVDHDEYWTIYPIKVFNDGDILMAWHDLRTYYYSNKTKVITEFDLFEVERDDLERPELEDGMSAVLYTPSFLSVRRFPEESISTF
ncbi:hypothetical protein ABFS83_05G061000 [Erythranthe nasuta]